MHSFLFSLATLFGLGHRWSAPGTWGTVATLPLAYLCMTFGALWHMGVVFFLFPIAIISAEIYERRVGKHDSKEVIIDEVLGFLITMIWLPITWQAFLAGFLLFRFLDIVKPFPISRLDQNMKGGLGTIADDVAAGVIANIILHVALSHTAILGTQSVLIQN